MHLQGLLYIVQNTIVNKILIIPKYILSISPLQKIILTIFNHSIFNRGMYHDQT